MNTQRKSQNFTKKRKNTPITCISSFQPPSFTAHYDIMIGFRSVEREKQDGIANF